MADKKEAGAKTQKKSGGGKTIFLMVIVGCLVPFGLPTLMICLGLLPTVVALFTDTDENRSGVAAVAYLNVAGVLPFLIDLWEKGQGMDVAMSIITQPFSWVVMLGAAGVGHVIAYVVPPIVGSVVLLNQENRLRVLRDGAEQLEAIWGTEVTTDKPISDIQKTKGM